MRRRRSFTEDLVPIENQPDIPPAMNRNTILPPFRALRTIVGILFLATAGLLILFGSAPAAAIFSIAVSCLLFLAGICILLVERRVVAVKERMEILVLHTVAGFAVSRVVHDISRADRILLATRREPVVDGVGVMYVADTTYPVLICAGDEILVRVTGWDVHRLNKKRSWDFSLPSPAFFLSYSKHAAAKLARALDLPLEYQQDALTYPPGQVPPEWLEEKTVQANLSWRRY
jgi:hypothetical protein